MARKNKKLLSEGQVRQFMKLANLEPLTPGFVYGMTEKKVMNFGDAEASHIKGDKPKRWEPDYGKKREHSPEEVGAATVAQPTTSSEPTEVDMPAKRVPTKPSPSKVDVPRAKQQRNPQAGMKRESHGRGRDEGDGGYGRPDARQRPAGSALREQDDLDVELDDLEGEELGFEDEELGLEDEELGLEDEELGSGGGREVSVDDFLAALEVALEDVMGEEVEVSQDEEGLEDEELGLEGELEGDELDLEAEEEDLELQERRSHAMQALVGRITRRVAERLVREKLTRRR